MLLNLKAISKIELIWGGYNHDLFVLRRISWPTSQFRPLVPQYLCYSVRIPNIKELQSIIHYGLWSPSIDPSFPGSTDPNTYWSSTTEVSNPTLPSAWNVSFNTGNVNAGEKRFQARARAVRGGR